MPGHPPDVSEDQAEAMRRRRSEGATLKQIGAELGVHHSTVADHLGESEPSPLAKRYAAMVVEIREALEANFREALDATEKGDYPRMVAAMKAKALLTQQAKGIVSARSLYVEQGEQETPEGKDAASFLAGLAKEKRKGKGAATTGGNGDRTTAGNQSSRRAASRAT